jgi:predicted nucleic acid-binding protein
MKGLFVDTSAWVASEDMADPRCQAVLEARDAWFREGGVLVTTDYVLAETLTTLRKRLGLHVAEGWWNRIENSLRVRWEWIGHDRAAKARALFFRHHDKDYSLTDCTSFVVMKELKLNHALATDKHFTQAGFRVLPAA